MEPAPRVVVRGAVTQVAAAAAGLQGCALGGPRWQLDRITPAWAPARTEALVRARGYAAALGATIAGLVELRDVDTGPASAVPSRSAGAQLPGAAAVEAACTLSPPDLEAI